jgi:hypothetical protein
MLMGRGCGGLVLAGREGSIYSLGAGGFPRCNGVDIS